MSATLPLGVAIVASGITYGTPLLIAGTGELVAERSGVINLGIEGTMLIGAAVGFWVDQFTSVAWLALVAAAVAAMAVGALAGLAHAFACITLRANQIVSGLAITIFGGAVGFSTYLASVGKVEGLSARHVFPTLDIGGLGHVAVVGPILLHQNILVYVSWLLAVLCWIYLFRTRRGLELRAVGDRPYAADAMGVSVRNTRYIHTIAGGALAGLAGVYYSLVLVPSWSDGLTAGAGWIALALVIFALWHPGLLVVGAYLFGVVTDLQFVVATHGVNVAPEVFACLPYVMTVVVITLISVRWRSGQRLQAPLALGVPYERGGS